MADIKISPMTVELISSVYDGFEFDPMTSMEPPRSKPSVYSKEWAEEYFRRQTDLNHVLFAIMLDASPIGELKLYNISKRRKSCEVSINLKCDAYKNRGYGTAALACGMEYARTELGMELMLARVLMKNLRAQRVLKKLGFKESYREFHTVYFERELNRVEEIKPMYLIPMSLELAHEFDKGFLRDTPPKGYRQGFVQHSYDGDSVNLRYELQMLVGRQVFAIMIEGRACPIGEVMLLKIDYEREYCGIECRMQSKEFKNRGYGKRAIIEMLEYARDDLKLKRVHARIPCDNTHARHVFESIGFLQNGTLGEYLNYEIVF